MGVVSGLGPSYDLADGSLRAMRATSGDYSAVEQFLCVDLRRLQATDFQDHFENSETPLDYRLLLKRREQIVGHVLLRFRDVRWGQSRIATCRFGPLDLLPEYRNSVATNAMLQAIERTARERRTVLIRADLADISQGGPLSHWPAHWLTTSGLVRFESHPQAILAELEIRTEKASTLNRREYIKSRRETHIRPFRQIELPALMKIYRSYEAAGFGFLHRTEDQWQSLARRTPRTHILVAVDHRRNRRIKQRGGQIVAYAVIRDNNIVEMIGLARHALATEHLLARICADAVERNVPTIQLPALSPGGCFHEVCAAAARSVKASKQSLKQPEIVCVPSEKLLVRRLGPELLRRWQSLGGGTDAELGWGSGDRACRLILSEKGAKLQAGSDAADRLICSHQVWIRLLIGELSAPVAFATDLLEASTPTAKRLAETLFPQLPVWHSSWDHSIDL
ncbi:MAG: hypothetical protein P8K78_09565 [Pirellulales bacterium]|nr:hypothetical protein [Pirellulales bacterium]